MPALRRFSLFAGPSCGIGSQIIYFVAFPNRKSGRHFGWKHSGKSRKWLAPL
jgi:hypothetical protein